MIESIRRSPARAWRPAFFCFLGLCSSVPAWGALDAPQVMILVNRDVPVSGQVAQMYQKLRGVPASNLLRLSMGTDRQITPAKYWSQAGQPVRKYLEEHPEIRCILTTSGVPYTVQGAEGVDEGAAFDNELAAILREQPGDQKRHQPNPLYLDGMNPYGVTDPRLLNMVYVARLDGPDLATMTRMVEDALAAEKSGLTGMAAGDAQGIDGVTGYGEGDATIRAAIDRFGAAGFPVNLDMKQETWKQPAGGVGNQAEGAAVYVGWYALLDFQNIFGARGLARGSIAWHIASQEAQDIWNPLGHGWCINLMRHGAAVTLGPVREPYVTAFPHGDIFSEALLSGMSVAESYWLSLPNVSWAMVILGDPLYRPFAANPRPTIVAKAYAATGPLHVLVRGETGSLLVELECVGAPGSSVPALTATVEPEMGLKAASGEVSIPALKAGESAIIRIPTVTAGDDPTGMFRLRLNARAEGQAPRRITLEGRIGFSRLTGSLGPKSHMFLSPDGSALISGKPGRDALIQTATLQPQVVKLPEGFVLSDVAFAPDGAHAALLLLDPKKKQGATFITDGKLSNAHSLSGTTPFLRWLDGDRVLLAGPEGLISHSVSGGPDRNLGKLPGPSGNVIPGKEIQFSVTADGQVMVKNGAAPFREVLQGSKVNRFIAIADDLSLIGGVDGENRLWVQHGLTGAPEMIASGVANILWGPISRRVLVLDAGHHARVYDGRDRSWKDLGIVAEAAWSPDEEGLLFVEGGAGSDQSLALWSGQIIQKLCPVSRLGQVSKIAFSADQKRAFLLAGIAGEPDVWTLPLPPRAPRPPGAK